MFEPNTRRIHFIMFSLSRTNGTLPHVYVYIYMYMYVYIYIHVYMSDELRGMKAILSAKQMIAAISSDGHESRAPESLPYIRYRFEE